ncbi:MAG TPA: hypothetical protein VF765_35290 [Polyangiaceae bacterium]
MRVWGPLLVAFLGACAHAEALHDGVLEKDDARIHLGPVPPEWRGIHVDGADVAYRDEAREGSVLFNVRCGQRDSDAPLSVLTEHLIMGTTEREFDTQETIPFDGREAQHTLMRAKLDGVPMQYDIYVMKKNGCVYDLVYVAPPDRFSQGAPAFDAFARGLHAATPNEATQQAGRKDAPANDP